MSQNTQVFPFTKTTGLDLGARLARWYSLDGGGALTAENWVPMTHEALTRLFTCEPQRVVMEACGPCRWVAALCKKLGHEVVIANPRQFHLISKSERKTDRRDARILAEVGQVRKSLLHPVQLRGEDCQRTRVLLAARRHLVEQRTGHVNFIRGVMRTLGKPLSSASVEVFEKRFRTSIPEEYKESLGPILDEIQALNDRIKSFDKVIERVSKEQYPDVEILRQVPGVGPLLSLTFLATLERHDRFKRSRRVGSYVGLTPREHSSGESNPQLRITKCGDRELRRLLVSAATWILTWGKDSNLRRLGERIRARQDQASRGKARIAVARKLAVTLHHLWKTGEVYQPLHGTDEADVA